MAQNRSNCLIAHEGTFTYQVDNDIIRIEIRGDKHTEFFPGGIIVHSDIKWIDECNYETTMTSIKNRPEGYIFEKGDMLKVHIDEVSGRHISLTIAFKNITLNGYMVKEK
jgi:hypothetical protein